jgi:DNA-binding response OmpR family regulator
VADQDKPLILIVDDMPDVAGPLAMMLEMRGYEVRLARDGHEALTMARERLPHLAVCDVVLPAMMGWELCQRLKAMAAPSHLPVIMLTAKATELDEVRSYEASADDHFTKPPDMKALIGTIDRLVKGAPKAS